MGDTASPAPAPAPAADSTTKPKPEQTGESSSTGSETTTATPEQIKLADGLTAAIKAFDKAKAAPCGEPEKQAGIDKAAREARDAAAATVKDDKVDDIIVSKVYSAMADKENPGKPYHLLFDALVAASKAADATQKATVKAAEDKAGATDESKTAAKEAAKKAHDDEAAASAKASKVLEALRVKDAFLGCGPGFDNMCGVRVTRTCGWF